MVVSIPLKSQDEWGFKTKRFTKSLIEIPLSILYRQAMDLPNLERRMVSRNGDGKPEDTGHYGGHGEPSISQFKMRKYFSLYFSSLFLWPFQKQFLESYHVGV